MAAQMNAIGPVADDSGPASRWRDLTGHPPAARVLMLCSLVAFVDGVDTQTIASLAPLIARSLGIEPAGMGLVLSAGLLGMMIGSLLFGSLADRVGRKRMIVVSIAIFGGGTLATVLAQSSLQLIALRFLTGVGIGGAMPNLLALSAEYAPPRSRAFWMNLMYCGYPVGGVAVGFIGSAVVGVFDWRAIYTVCGVASLLLALPVQLLLPESREVGRGATAPSDQSRATVRRLFVHGRAATTLLLWLAMFLALMIIIFMVSWLTVLLTREGVPIARAVLYPSLFSLGGIAGSVAVGFIMDRSRPLRIVAFAMLAGSAALASIDVVMGRPVVMAISTFMVGFLVIGSQTGLQTVAATLYPPELRSTGIGWAIAIGRIGSIIAPMIGALLIAAHWSAPAVLATAALPALLACITIAALDRAAHRASGIVTPGERA